MSPNRQEITHIAELAVLILFLLSQHQFHTIISINSYTSIFLKYGNKKLSWIRMHKYLMPLGHCFMLISYEPMWFAAIKHPMELLTWDLLESWPPHLLLKMSCSPKKWMNPATSFLLTFPPHIRTPKSQAGKRDVSKWDAEPSWGDGKVGGPVDASSICTPAPLTTRQPSAATWALEWNNCSQPHAAPTSCALRCHRAHVAGRPPNAIYQHSYQTHTPLELGFKHSSSC